MLTYSECNSGKLIHTTHDDCDRVELPIYQVGMATI